MKAAEPWRLIEKCDLPRNWDAPTPAHPLCLAVVSRRGYAINMTQEAAQILREVERLSRAEQTELRRRLCERVPMSEDLTDEDLAELAAASFRALDQEENEGT